MTRNGAAMRPGMLLMVMVACTAGCESEAPIALPAAPQLETPAPVVPTVATPTPVTATPRPPAPAASPPVATKAPPTGLPSLTKRAGDDAASARARAQNTAGFKAYKAGKLEEAARQYEAAVRSDPQHILARYNLACVWNKLGDTRGLGVLTTFKRVGCRACLERLRRARVDSDFADKWDDPEFKAITAERAPGPTTVADVARAVERAYLAGDHAPLAPFLSGTIEMVRVCTVCDPPDDRRTTAMSAARLPGAIDRERGRRDGDEGPFFNGFESMRCDAKCCVANRETIMHQNTYLDRVCAMPQGAGKTLRLSLVEIADG